MPKAEQFYLQGNGDRIDFAVKNLAVNVLNLLVISVSVDLSLLSRLVYPAGLCEGAFFLPWSSAMAQMRLES